MNHDPGRRRCYLNRLHGFGLALPAVLISCPYR